MGISKMLKGFGKTALWFFAAVAILLSTQMAHADILGKIIKPLVEAHPGCDDKTVLKEIIKRFNQTEEKTWQRGFGIETISRPRQRKLVQYDNSKIARLYCRGHAHLTNGRHPTVLYVIEGGQGFAGTGFKVAYCVNGLDPWRSFDGSCRAINY